MPSHNLNHALDAAVDAARAAGRLMRDNHRAPKRVNEATRHDIKLELDVRCQTLIEQRLRRAFPSIPILGEEGVVGRPDAPWRWVVDPIDGTVNFAYGIPHCCTSIALQRRLLNPTSDAALPGASRRARSKPAGSPDFETVLGVIHDPFCDELWTAVRGRKARLNGRPIRVSDRTALSECLVSVGFAKNKATMRRTLPTVQALIPRARKVRIMGAAALGLVYVACGRLDAYIEFGLRIWDVAAGGLILECAGGDFWNRPLPGPYTYHIVASNGRLHRHLNRFKD